MRRVLFGLMVAAACVAAAGARTRSAADDAGLFLQVSDPAALLRVSAGYENIADGSFSTAPITDIMIEIRPGLEKPRSTAWIAPDDRLRSFVDVRLFLVSGGRIDATGEASCGHFDGDILVCQLACEGGAFGLRRGRNRGSHHLIVGMRAPQLTPIRNMGFKVGACVSSGRPAMLVLPSAGRLAVDVPLVELP